MSNIPDTQLDAWYDLLSTVTAKRSVVLSALQEPATLFELSERLGWPVNRISGRLTELKNLNVISDSGARRKNPASGKNGIVWKRT